MCGFCIGGGERAQNFPNLHRRNFQADCCLSLGVASLSQLCHIIILIFRKIFYESAYDKLFRGFSLVKLLEMGENKNDRTFVSSMKKALHSLWMCMNWYLHANTKCSCESILNEINCIKAPHWKIATIAFVLPRLHRIHTKPVDQINSERSKRKKENKEISNK